MKPCLCFVQTRAMWSKHYGFFFFLLRNKNVYSCIYVLVHEVVGSMCHYRGTTHRQCCVCVQESVLPQMWFFVWVKSCHWMLSYSFNPIIACTFAIYVVSVYSMYVCVCVETIWHTVICCVRLHVACVRSTDESNTAHVSPFTHYNYVETMIVETMIVENVFSSQTSTTKLKTYIYIFKKNKKRINMSNIYYTFILISVFWDSNMFPTF